MITWEREGNVIRMKMPLSQQEVEAEDKREGFTPLRGILFGLLFSSPFWALFAYLCWIR